jgi:hypothetical protein
MSGGGDLAECYTANVTWTTTETGEELRTRLRFVTTLLRCTTTCSTPKREGLSSPMGTPISRATVSRRPPVAVAGSTTASHTTSSRTESQRCAATVRSLVCLPSSPAILTSELAQDIRRLRQAIPFVRRGGLEFPVQGGPSRSPVGSRTPPVHRWLPGSRHGVLGVKSGRRGLIG